MRLPVMPMQQAVEVPNASHELKPLSILIIDDNQDAAENLGALLRIDGYTVNIACEGVTGLQLLSATNPDVVLLDIGMPDMDGYAVIEQMPNDNRPYVIAVTGYGQESDKEQTRMAGFDAHLVKPVQRRHLLELLHRVPNKG